MSLAPELAHAAKAWIDYWRHQLETGQFPDNEDGHTVDRLIREEPDLGWAAILAILQSIDAEPSSRLFQVLAGGPLEDLLSNHGDVFVERVEAEAKKNSRFSLLLGGVWQNTMSERVWARVQACRTEAW